MPAILAIFSSCTPGSTRTALAPGSWSGSCSPSGGAGLGVPLRPHQRKDHEGGRPHPHGLLIFEQHLYLRQPGYGTSYVTAKDLLERTLTASPSSTRSAESRPGAKTFFDRLHRVDSIPIAIGRWEMTGLDDERGVTSPK